LQYQNKTKGQQSQYYEYIIIKLASAGVKGDEMILRPRQSFILLKIYCFWGGFSMSVKNRPLEMAISGCFSIF